MSGHLDHLDQFTTPDVVEPFDIVKSVFVAEITDELQLNNGVAWTGVVRNRRRGMKVEAYVEDQGNGGDIQFRWLDPVLCNEFNTAAQACWPDQKWETDARLFLTLVEECFSRD